MQLKCFNCFVIFVYGTFLSGRTQAYVVCLSVFQNRCGPTQKCSLVGICHAISRAVCAYAGLCMCLCIRGYASRARNPIETCNVGKGNTKYRVKEAS
jgi:hypothetical protein